MNTLIVVSTDCGIHLVRLFITRLTPQDRANYISESLATYFGGTGGQTVEGWVELADLNTRTIG